MFSRLCTRRTIGIALLLSQVIHVAVARAEEPKAWVEKNLASLTEIYRHFHQHPELSFEEEQTSRRLAEELASVGAKVTEKVGGHGVVAVLENGKGPTLLLRTDLDALPVTEQTGLDYASRVQVKDARGSIVGVMHACGHDIHITNLIGVARYLAKHREQWSGTLVMIGQPAEERGAGAKAMLEDGLFRRFPKPDFCVALHVDATLAAGKVAYLAGYSLANVDSVDIVVKGRGGHGAYPDTTIDPIVTAARLIVDLQTIVSREIKPTDPAVITVGSIQGGTKHNIIPDSCSLQLTVRSYSDEVREHLLAAIRRKALAAAASAGAPEPEISVGDEGTPSLWNDAELTARLAKVFQRTLGEDFVEISEPSMGGEDFSRYGREGVPILMYRLGSVAEDRLAKYADAKQTPPSLHSPIYYPDPELSLATGVTTMSAVVLELLRPQK
jgi:amidohydrolase